jgi:NADH oxidase (H2O2-forming)
LAKIVIIGLGTAGISAALTIRKSYPTNEIIIIDKKPFDLLHSCGLPFLLDGTIDSPEKLKYTLRISGIKKYLNCEATKIDPTKKNVEIQNLETGTKENISYDSLILATGVRSFIPSLPGMSEFKGKKVFTIDDLSSVARLWQLVKRAKTALVIGAGATGLETAVALNKIGLKVTIAETLGSLLPRIIDPDMSEIIEHHLKEKRIKILLNRKIERVSEKSVIVEGKEIPNDIVVLSCGVRPDLRLARTSGIKTSKYGIIINGRMETNVNQIYACGDCVESFTLIDKKPFSAYLAAPAYAQGRIAALNACGDEEYYEGTLATFVCLIGDLEVASAGFNRLQAEGYGYKIVEGKARSFIKPKWFPGAKELTSKIIADIKTGRILGVQEIGAAGTAWRINTASLAIKSNLSLEGLGKVEFAYSPAISHIPDVLLTASRQALRKLANKKPEITGE